MALTKRLALSEIQIRCATPADYDRLAALFAKSYGTLLCGHYDAERLAGILPIICKPQAALLASTTFYVAEVNDSISACGGWTETVPGSTQVLADTGHVRHFATDPAMLRRGLASEILHRCKTTARIAGFKQLQCWSTHQAAGFYEKHGFQRMRDFDVAFPGGATFASVEMNCSLVDR